MKALMWAIALILGSAGVAWTAQDEQAETPPPSRHFEVEVIGKGAPEVLVWFGAATPSPEELGNRRALAAELRGEVKPGSGSFHVVIDLGPSEKTPAFGFDFPVVQVGGATRFQPRCLRRSDARALAGYLVATPGLAGVVELPSVRPGLVRPTRGNLPDFLRIGLGLQRRLPKIPAALPGETQAQATAGSLLTVLDAARAGLASPSSAALNLGGDLWQFDLNLKAPELAIVRPDPEREYPAVRLALGLAAWGDQPATEASPDETAPIMVELAWRAQGADAFQRLEVQRGGFAFPGGKLPAHATLRVVAHVPSSLDDVEFTLDAGSAGRAACVVALGRPEVPAPDTSSAPDASGD